MSFISDILKSVDGSLNCSLNFHGKEAAIISLAGKELLFDVKDPFAFMDFGLLHSFMKRKGESKTMQKLKDAGFKVSLKYKGFKIDL